MIKENKVLWFLALVLVAIAISFTVYPIMELLLSSFGIFSYQNLKLDIRQFSISGYIDLISFNPEFFNGLLNSLKMMAIVLPIKSIFSFLTAYFFYDINGKIARRALLILVAMPIYIILIPYLLLLSNYNYSNFEWLFLWIIMVISPLNIYFYDKIIRLVPIDCIEAAKLDGATDFQLIKRILLPIIGKNLYFAVLIGGVEIWGAIIQPLLILKNKNNFTVPLHLSALYASSEMKYSVASIIFIIPIIEITLFFKNRMRGNHID